MKITTILGTAILVGALTNAAAQTAEPTYKGDPDVYKVIFEDANFRVIEALRKKGVHDKPHGHPAPSIVYNVTDCKTKQYAADGKATEREREQGWNSHGGACDRHAFGGEHGRCGLQADFCREEIAHSMMARLLLRGSLCTRRTC